MHFSAKSSYRKIKYAFFLLTWCVLTYQPIRTRERKKKLDTVPKWPELKKERLRSIVIAFFSSGHLGMA
jgi:hypothetical protein